ncbi:MULTISPECIES: flagellar motor stator protein MotA [Caballeronia]|uniref:Flagellar motor protein MotA n=1 Tax=Caballeronia cordobensis TaxID=1353886 RepID=A0A158F108_CABCO|nr:MULTISPECIES: flagellar motor stator protein MotA [Caballeronia]AET87953.1 flagellar motor protein MotA [Burkholderia sp. YI23]AQG97507.1 flagellar motor stator protein MotA [Burkholderia sp. KK1]BAO85179.1 flagellar motor protein MotA [Burkholderia sp. RPE67]BBP95006.1 flagellar motor protein MotA [Burkholderia sp. SFA1]MCE4543114.1 flagellar motor stator protein MotA [Caballeronia sp. PC1]
MLIFIGSLVTLLSVFGGYAIEGGHLGALMQPVEILMIGGAGVGAFILGNNVKTIKATIQVLPTLFKGAKYDKSMYMELMGLLYVLLAKARKEGTLALEADIEDPSKSPVFSQYPKIVADHHIVEFLTDYLRLMVSGNMNAFEIESLMDEEIETHHVEGEAPAHALTKVGDAMPAFGIVAAVMGVVHTMASADQPPAILGEMIAQALVGTFLGILLSYGFIGPLANVAEQRVAEQTKMFQCIKVTILASLNGYAPAIAVEFGRKVLFSTERPSFSELEEHVRRVKSK